MSDPTSSDQALINAKILFQLDAIGKHLNVIESNSVSRSWPKVEKSVCKPIAVSSNLATSHGEDDLQKNMPNLHAMRHDRYIPE